MAGNTQDATPGLREFRCRRCGRLLCRHALVAGVLEILCDRPRCKTLNVLVAEPEVPPVRAVGDGVPRLRHVA